MARTRGEIVGERMVVLRRRKGWTQPELAQQAGMGITTLNRIENAHVSMTMEKVVALARPLVPSGRARATTFSIVIDTWAFSIRLRVVIPIPACCASSGCVQPLRRRNTTIRSPTISPRVRAIRAPPLLRKILPYATFFYNTQQDFHCNNLPYTVRL